MKLYAFTEQGLKELLDKQKQKSLDSYDNCNDILSIRSSLRKAPYPAFPEPIELPELNDIEISAHKHSIFNKEKTAYVSGANHIIKIIKNGLK